MRKLIDSLPTFKCRASKAGLLGVGYKIANESDISRITELKNERDTLINANGRKVKWTDSKKKELENLEYLVENPQLGESIKSYLKEWLISKLSGKEKSIDSKYLKRGLAVEDLAIERIGRYYGVKCENNKKQLENDFFTGEFDTIVNLKVPMIVDAKSPWDIFTFPYFEDSEPLKYYDQEQIYLDLSGEEKGGVAFCLENGTEEEIEKLSWKHAKKEGFEEPEIQHWDKAEQELNYDHLPDCMRIRVFEFEKDNARIKQMQQWVIECRIYINEVLIPQLEKLSNNQNKIK